MRSLLRALVWVPFASAAYAQSTGTVGINGTLDLYFGQARFGSATQWRLNDGGGSRLSFFGNEDLGSGYRAYFRLDAAFNPDTGGGTGANQSFIFQRESKLGLAAPWGQVELGRLYNPAFLIGVRWSPLNLNMVWSAANVLATAEGQPGLAPFAPRISNMVRYRTPDLNGFTADLSYAPGESTNGADDFRGGSLAWEKGPVFLGYALQKTKTPLAAGFPAIPSVTTQQTLVAVYAFDWIKLGLTAASNRSTDGSVPHARLAGLSASSNISTNSRVSLEFVRREVKGTARGQNALTLGYDYFLSKRTSLYGRWLQLQNKGPSSAPIAQTAVAANSGDDIRVIGLGIRHDF